MPLARFVAFHREEEVDLASRGHSLLFAVVIAHAPDGVMLVFNRYRQLWELPGGLIDTGENARSAAARELYEEAGAETDELEWLGITEVDDGSRHFGAVFRGVVRKIAPTAVDGEIGAVSYWRAGADLQPLGHTDAALLARFG
jgi:8-oxo-dGTP diphosphatase